MRRRCYMLCMGTLLILSVVAMTGLAIGLSWRNIDRRRNDPGAPTDYGSGGGSEIWIVDSDGGRCDAGGGDSGGGGGGD